MRSYLTAFFACATVLVVFAGGLWLGGHPGELPDPLRDVFVEDDRSIRAELIESIDEDYFKKVDTDKILKATGLVKALTASLAALFIFASVALVANTIRLSLFARRHEIEVMKLVGATNWFIRWPFVIEGVIVGLMGGVLATLMLLLAKETLVDPLADRFALLATPDTIDFPLLVAMLMVACVLVSAMGSGITLRRFLRV